MSKVYNVPLECHFFKELAQIVIQEKDIVKIFLPNNRSCRAFKREISKFNCIVPEIISISDVLNFPDISFHLLNFLRNNTFSIPFSTLFDLSSSLATLVRNLVFNKADYRQLLIPEKFNESWKSTLLILDRVFENLEILSLKDQFELQMNRFFSSIAGEKIVVAGLLEENFYNKLLYSQALDTGFVVVSGLENKSGENFKKISRLLQNSNDGWGKQNDELSLFDGFDIFMSTKCFKSKNCESRQIIELSSNSDEARVIALITRDMIEKNKSVLIVSPNLSLTQKIKIEMLKWNIIADDSSGIPLYCTHCGQIVSQIISVIENNFQNEDVLNLLKFNDFLKKEVLDLENFLRTKGNYPQNFFQTFELFFPKKKADDVEIEFEDQESTLNLFQDARIGKVATRPFLVESDEKNFSEGDHSERIISDLDEKNLGENVKNLADFADELKNFAEFPESADFNFWLGYFSDFLGLIKDSVADEFSKILHPQELENISLSEFCVFLKNHFLNNSVRRNINYTPGVVILGILESQLADADLVIVCGANESFWKSSDAADFWMSDSMLRQLGINTVDERNEFYACVWEKLISKPNVIVTRSIMENGEQTQGYSRLKNCELKQDVIYTGLIQRIKLPSKFSPISFKSPSPKIDFRPTTFWVSDLDLLISNPYVYYAKKILRLKELTHVNSRKNLKGNLVHKIFDEFTKKQIRDKNLSMLQYLFKKICRENFINSESLGLWYFNVDSILMFFVENFNINSKSFSEIEGHIDLDLSYEDKNIQIIIASKADCLEMNSAGNISIIDYKTGEIPSIKKVKNGEKIQLPVETLIAINNGFKLGKTTVETMSFWQMKAKEKRIVFVSKTQEESKKICKEVLEKVEALLREYLLVEIPYNINRDDKYNKIYMQLARVKEIRENTSEID